MIVGVIVFVCVCVCLCVFVCLWLGEITEVFLLLFVHLMIFGEVNVPHEPSHNLS